MIIKCRELHSAGRGPLIAECVQDCLSTVPSDADELATEPDVNKATTAI